MSYAELHLDAKTAIARTSIAAWNALMRSDSEFGRYALSATGRSEFLTAFTVIKGGMWLVGRAPHRTDGPARTYANNAKEWDEYGQLHRIGGPAVIRADGSEEWYERGRLHRIGGPASTYINAGFTTWNEHGKLHRIGAPAIVYANGDESWYENGQLHRVGGPARTWADGRTEWYDRGIARRAPR